jgi:hypothetical protein
MFLKGFEGVIPLDEAPAPTVLVDEVADGVAEIVDANNLRLRGSRVVLSCSSTFCMAERGCILGSGGPRRRFRNSPK